MNRTAMAKKVAETFKEAYDFSSVQIQIPEDLANEIYQWGLDNIPDTDLCPTEKGRETDIHITLKYGLHNFDFTEVRNILGGKGPINIELGPMSLFNSDNYDVLKIDIISSDLHRLNKQICKGMEYTDTFPKYKPHLTLAYLNKGAGDKFVGNKDFKGRKMRLDSVLFSGHDNRRTMIKLSTIR